MPELPEVETTRRGITPHILGKHISQVNIYFPKLRWVIDPAIKIQLKNQKLLNIERRGKYIALEFPKGNVLLHLGMSGSLRVLNKHIQKEKHDHFEMVFENNKALRLRDPRRFGAVIWCPDDWREHELINKLGPEPLTNEFTGEHLYKLSRKKSCAVKNFIMDSHVVVGVGNIYASESLFLAGINPKRAANKISKQRYDNLAQSIKQVLTRSIEQGGTTLKDFSDPHGNPGYFTLHLNVYGRQGETCLQCGLPIIHCVIGQRATYYCAQCQR